MRIALVTLVLSLAAAATGAAQHPRDDTGTSTEAGFLRAPDVMKSAIGLANNWIGEKGAPPGDGFYPDFGNMITGAGWISIGPGYRKHLFDERAFVDGSAAISWHGYKMAQAR